MSNSPYRDNAKPAGDPLRKYMRTKARLRGLLRRIVLPIKVVFWFSAIGLLFNTCMWLGANDRADNADAVARRHFDDWQAMIDRNQAAMNTRQADLDRHEHEFNARVRNFEDILGASAILSRNSNDPTPTLEALKRAGVTKTAK